MTNIDDGKLSDRKQQGERLRLTKLIDDMTMKARSYREASNLLMKQEELLRIAIVNTTEKLSKLDSKVKL